VQFAFQYNDLPHRCRLTTSGTRNATLPVHRGLPNSCEKQNELERKAGNSPKIGTTGAPASAGFSVSRPPVYPNRAPCAQSDLSAASGRLGPPRLRPMSRPSARVPVSSRRSQRGATRVRPNAVLSIKRRELPGKEGNSLLQRRHLQDDDITTRLSPWLAAQLPRAAPTPPRLRLFSKANTPLPPPQPTLSMPPSTITSPVSFSCRGSEGYEETALSSIIVQAIG